MLRLLIPMGDFADALDTGVRFAARGTPTQVLAAEAHHFTEKDAGVLIIDTEARHLSPKETSRIVRALTESAIHAGISCVYKKIDSAFRDSVGAKLEAAFSGNGESVLPFLPTFPELGRITVGNRQYINRIPVNGSPFGKDPFESVRMAEVTTLLGLQSSLPAESFPSLEANGTVPSGRGILILGAGSEEELFASNRVLFQDTVPRVPAGCTGFATYLPELLGLGAHGDSNLPELSPRLLILCGSVNPITYRQLFVAAGESFGYIHLTPQEKVLPSFFATAAGDAALQVLRGQPREHPRFTIDNNDAGDNMETKNYAKNLGLSLDELHFRIANALGTVLAELIEEPTLSTSLLTDGDTLLQCINALGIRRVEPVGELESGIVLCRFSYRGKRHTVITKSGRFGEEDSLPCSTHFLEKKTEGEKR